MNEQNVRAVPGLPPCSLEMKEGQYRPAAIAERLGGDPMVEELGRLIGKPRKRVADRFILQTDLIELFEHLN